MKILNNLNHVIYVSVYQHVDDAEDSSLFKCNNPIGSEHIAELDIPKDSHIYICGYDKKKKIQRGDRVSVNCDKLEVCENVYGEFVKVNENLSRKFNADYVLGCSYVFPNEVCYFYNFCIYITYLFMIIAAAAVLYLLLI